MEAFHYQSGEKSLIEKEDLKQLEKAINSLSDKYKEVILLSRFEGLKNNVIAVKLHVSVRTVETRIYRALVCIKEKISAKSFFVLMALVGIGKLKNQKT
jgi:RNA polymerase sigma-70 factor (ECF subfamily)